MPIDHQAIAMLDLNWEYLRWNSLRSTRRKLLYVATPKVACTSLKWWFARLEGYGGVLQSSSEESKETASELIIHDSLHKVAPDITGLPPEGLAEAIQSDEYFRFALVRNPFKRIFSAWQSKLLLREPLQVGPYLDKAFYHHPISSKADVAEAFEAFLEHLVSEEAPTFWDVHWTPQADLLRPNVIRYTSLSQIENVSELEKLLGDWLGSGVASPFANRSSNESLMPYHEEFFSDRSAKIVRALYSADFERFGYSTDLPKAKEGFSFAEFDLALKAIDMIRARHERIGVMRTVAERKVHDLQIVAASKDENLKAIRNVVAEAVNQQAQLQRESLDTLGTKLDELGSINHQAMERERQLADALARMESLSERAVRLETERSQLLNELALSEVNRLQLEKEKAAYEAHFAGLQRDCAEKEHDRAALKDELDRAMLSVRSLRDGVVQHQLTASTPLTEEAAPVDLRLELEGLQKQIEPLQKLPAQIEALNQVASQFDSLRFLARRFFAVLGNRWTGRRI